MKMRKTNFIELDFIKDIEKEKAYQALINTAHIVDIWENEYGFCDLRVSAGNHYSTEYSTLNTYEEIKAMLKKGSYGI